jgi:hypothetical protein
MKIIVLSTAEKENIGAKEVIIDADIHPWSMETLRA